MEFTWICGARDSATFRHLSRAGGVADHNAVRGGQAGGIPLITSRNPENPYKAYPLQSGRINILCSYGSPRLSSPPRTSASLAFNLNAMDAEGRGGKGGVMSSGKPRAIVAPDARG